MWKRKKKSLYWHSRKKKTKEAPSTCGIGTGKPKICVSLTGHTEGEILEQAEMAASSPADLVEWRADYYEHAADAIDSRMLAARIAERLAGRPLIYTYRTAAEGGEGALHAELYGQLLIKLSESSAIPLIDVEACRPEFDAEGLIGAIRDRGTAVIGSVHFFKGTPSKKEMENILLRLSKSSADMIKMAVMPEKPSDVLKLMTVTEKMHRKIDKPLITMAMGELGMLSRISGSLTGSALTFGALKEASAPGQLPVDDLKAVLEKTAK